MFDFAPDAGLPKAELYRDLLAAADALTAGEPDSVANMANVAALLGEYLPQCNWAGFYRAVGGELVLGPFVGRPACIRIAFGKGVCGTAAATGRRSWWRMSTPSLGISPATRRAGPNWWRRYCAMGWWLR